jgi:hypothetical protein
MHGRNKEFGCDVTERADLSAASTDSVPKFGKNVEAFAQHAGRGDASIGTRFWEIAVEHFPKSIADRGVTAPDGRTSQPPKRSRVSFAVPA